MYVCTLFNSLYNRKIEDCFKNTISNSLSPLELLIVQNAFMKTIKFDLVKLMF